MAETKRNPVDERRYQQALMSPLMLKKPGTEEWAWQITQALKRKWEIRNLTEKEWLKVLEEAKQGKPWEVLGFKDFDEYLKAEIGHTEEESIATLQTHGGDRRSEQAREDQVAIGNLKTKGTNQASYLLARLKRDAPEILEKLRAGEFPSVRQAAIAAKIITPPTPLEVVKKAYQKLSEDEKTEFLRWAK